MRAFPMDAQAYVGVGAPIRADYYVVSPHNITREPWARATIYPWGVSSQDTPQTPQKHFPPGNSGGEQAFGLPPLRPPFYTKLCLGEKGASGGTPGV